MRTLWTPEAAGALIRMRAEGFSFAQIAKELDYSRNACIGKRYRIEHPDSSRRKTDEAGERQLRRRASPVGPCIEVPPCEAFETYLRMKTYGEGQ